MTDQLALFDAKPQPRMRPSEPILRQALLEPPYRYWLKRAWGPGPAVAWVGLNPSTADDRRDDPTMQAEMGFSFRLGFGSLVKLNIYPFVSSDPVAAKRWRQSFVYDFSPAVEQVAGGDLAALAAYERNLDIAGAEIARCGMVIAAWGEGGDRVDVIDLMLSANLAAAELHQQTFTPIAWHCLAKTASGAPRHTLARGKHFIPRDAKPIVWDGPELPE